ncbi:hypothetical protein TNCV_3488221 [Trichonephila clavipes]|nr:hypothetical protein TNCV_3488221 [Trichonephila clavipes]
MVTNDAKKVTKWAVENDANWALLPKFCQDLIESPLQRKVKEDIDDVSSEPGKEYQRLNLLDETSRELYRSR